MCQTLDQERLQSLVLVRGQSILGLLLPLPRPPNIPHYLHPMLVKPRDRLELLLGIKRLFIVLLPGLPTIDVLQCRNPEDGRAAHLQCLTNDSLGGPARGDPPFLAQIRVVYGVGVCFILPAAGWINVSFLAGRNGPNDRPIRWNSTIHRFGRASSSPQWPSVAASRPFRLAGGLKHCWIC